jgi:hypothetical protein
MAMFSLSSGHVEKYLNSNEFIEFSIGISRRLNVNDLFSGIEYQGVEKKFPVKDALAFAHFVNNYAKFDGIYFLTRRIANETEKLYPNCMDIRKKEGILKILVDFLLIHELTHLAQFKRGFNEELRKQAKLNSMDYKVSWLEREANLQAYKYLRRRNEFTKKVSRRIWKVFHE